MKPSIEELAQTSLLLQLEKEAELTEYQSIIKNTSLKERRKEGLLWHPLRLAESGFSTGSSPYLIYERNPGDKGSHRFQAGSPVLVFNPENPEQSARGVVKKVDDLKIQVLLHEEDIPEWADERDMAVQLAFDFRTFQEMDLAMNMVINADRNRLAELREIILGFKSPAVSDEPVLPNLPDLNEKQKEAVELILRSSDLAIVHGPPGTGKTTTLVAAIMETVRSDQQVLACAPSNAAVDHLARQLHSRGVKVLRIGQSSRISEDLSETSLEHAIRSSKEFREIQELLRQSQELRKSAGKYKRNFSQSERDQRREFYRMARELNAEARKLEEYLQQRVVDEAQVICSTLVGSTSRELRGKRFGTVFIDEAGQALEPLTWIAVCRAEKVVMAGDPYQLPPVIKSREAMKKGLETTLLEKAIERSSASVMLETQYRMNSVIMGYSNEWFYRGKLHPAPGIGDHVLLEGEPALEFIDTAGCGFEEERTDESSSLKNSGEAQLLKTRLEQLYASLPEAPDTGIISPYNDQVKLLSELLLGSGIASIHSVDSFQGQERDLICISMVRSNDRLDIGFLSDYRRMNVAMTRARKKLLIAGDSATLAGDPFYEGLLKYIEEHGWYRSGWELMS